MVLIKYNSLLLPLLEKAIARGNTKAINALLPFLTEQHTDLKQLFLYCCEQKQGAIANQLLAKDIELSVEQIKTGLTNLFGQQETNAEIFDAVYQSGYGHLYKLLFKAKDYQPSKHLLTSIKNA